MRTSPRNGCFARSLPCYPFGEGLVILESIRHELFLKRETQTGDLFAVLGSRYFLQPHPEGRSGWGLRILKGRFWDIGLWSGFLRFPLEIKANRLSILYDIFYPFGWFKTPSATILLQCHVRLGGPLKKTGQFYSQESGNRLRKVARIAARKRYPAIAT